MKNVVTEITLEKENIRDLLRLLREKGFSSSVRLGIMVYLFVKEKAYFTDMATDLGLTPGNLWSHLVKLRDAGLVETRYVIRDRPRRLIVITDKGFRETLILMRLMRGIVKTSG
jgi:DNA-binding MarR family transcriptional regulator